MLKSFLLPISCVVLLLHSISSVAADDWHWHGFVSQGLMQARNSNFVNNDDDVSTDLTELGINGSYQISPSVRVAAQLMSLNGGNRYADGWRIDYVSATPQLAGKLSDVGIDDFAKHSDHCPTWAAFTI